MSFLCGEYLFSYNICPTGTLWCSYDQSLCMIQLQSCFRNHQRMGQIVLLFDFCFYVSALHILIFPVMHFSDCQGNSVCLEIEHQHTDVGVGNDFSAYTLMFAKKIQGATKFWIKKDAQLLDKILWLRIAWVNINAAIQSICFDLELKWGAQNPDQWLISPLSMANSPKVKYLNCIYHSYSWNLFLNSVWSYLIQFHHLVKLFGGVCFSWKQPLLLV